MEADDGAALAAAICGGCLWAAGVVGKRYGVEGASSGQRIAWSAFTSLVFLLGTLALPAAQLSVAVASGTAGGAFDAAWLRRLPWVVAAGLVNGLGSLLGMYSLVLAGPCGGSALVAVVQNGVFTAAAPLLLAAAFQESASPCQWLGVAAVCCGVPFMDTGLAACLDACAPQKAPRLLVARAEKDEEEEEEETADRACRVEEADVPACLSSEGPAHCNVGWAVDCGRTEKGTLGGASVEHGYGTFLPGVPPGSGGCIRGALLSASATGVLWAVGVLGRRYGARGNPPMLHQQRSLLTFLAINSASCLPPGLCLARAVGAADLLRDPGMLRRVPVVAAAGALAGLGGLLSTVSLALADSNSGAKISTVSNGVYTICGALLIAGLYLEWPTPAQWSGVGLIVAGITLMGL